MRPSPLSLAATVTYHRIILISRGKTAGGSWPSSPTFLHFPRPRRLLAFSCPRLEKRNRLRPLVGVSTGVGRPVSTLLGPPSSLDFQVPGGADVASSAETRKIRVCLAHSCDPGPFRGWFRGTRSCALIYVTKGNRVVRISKN